MESMSPLHKTLIAVAIAQTLSLPAGAAIINVNSLTDVSADDGLCTLREALISSNNNTASGVSAGECLAGSAGEDSITFNGLPTDSTIILSDQLEITEDLKINEPGLAGLTIQAGNFKRVLKLSAASLSLYSLTVSGGGIQTANQKGAGIYAGAGSTLALNNTTISGNTVNISGAGIFAINATVTLTDSLITQNGPGPGLGVSLMGGGLAVYGSTLTLNNSTVSNNSASNRGGGILCRNNGTVDINNDSQLRDNRSFVGGGLYASSCDVTIQNSIISGNYGKIGGGLAVSQAGSLAIFNTTIADNSVFGSGGGLAIGSNATIEASMISNNRAENGGGISANAGAIVTINNSTISGNTANDSGASSSTSKGGGIWVSNGATSNGATLSLINSTLSGNYSSRWGGGGAASSQFAPKLILRNSTVSNNSAGGIASGNGGGLMAAVDGGLEVLNSTVSGNMASNFGGGIDGGSAGNSILQNSIVSGNAAPTAAEISGAFPLLESNLLGDSSRDFSAAFLSATFAPSNIVAVSDGGQPVALSSILLPLANNGGSTQTHALPAGSPAIDAGDQALCLSETLVLDQRGEPRSDGRCDIGAYEYIEDSSCFIIRSQSAKTVVFCL